MCVSCCSSTTDCDRTPRHYGAVRWPAAAAMVHHCVGPVDWPSPSANNIISLSDLLEPLEACKFIITCFACDLLVCFVRVRCQVSLKSIGLAIIRLLACDAAAAVVKHSLLFFLSLSFLQSSIQLALSLSLSSHPKMYLLVNFYFYLGSFSLLNSIHYQLIQLL